MNFILFDGPRRNHLLPFTFTRPVSEIRVGIMTLKERWEAYLKASVTSLTEAYLSVKYPVILEDNNVFIDASILPSKYLITIVGSLKAGEVIKLGEVVIAYCSSSVKTIEELQDFKKIDFNEDIVQINSTWDIFDKNADILQSDFDFITEGRKSQPISDTNRVIHPERIFLEEGARVEFSILNATDGPIYLGKNSEIWEGSLVRGALALCDNAIIKMGGKLYGATTIGPFSKVCGEVSNSVIFGYSSKGHEGYLGNAVLGEWCNIGADSNNSNLKNNYAKVRLWDYATERFEQTGLQFCGLMMGDHSKTAINTMFNTGTVIGVNSNIYVPGFPRNFVPSFSWGGASGFTTYQPAKAFDAAKVMMARRGVEFNEVEADILTHVFELTKKWRKY
ncbi:GlmU family protein [Maribacter sp. M208]|uniref:GlmU family protein n=1 Tax=Maribacter huludaoensis TaxID=3030010 RepID=UPI0023EDE85D|nr:GlmU family protein [Maribacter huludaoensis]MDF4221971.1 GlmU family protein [Maribacter huludaoensis]